MSDQHAPTDDLLPTFKTARGTVAEWIDPQRQRGAAAHYASNRFHVQVAATEASRAAHPEWPAYWHEPFPFTSPDVPEIWEPEALVHEVRVLFPDRSMTLTYRPRSDGLALIGKEAVNSRVKVSQYLEGTEVAREFVQANKGYSRDDLDAYCYGPHSQEALALLQPRCFFHGREPRWEERVDMEVLGRAAYLVPMARTIPLSDPRILGDAYNPTVLDETEETEVIVDAERNVVLEWRGVFDGQPYERHFFTEIHFDEPMDEAAFELAE